MASDGLHLRPPSSPEAGPAAERFGNYLLYDKVGDGGFAEVFLASELGETGEPGLVIKRLHQHLEDHRESVEMFVTEARLMAELDHPNIVRIQQLERIDDRWAIVMERVDCDSLAEVFDLAVRIGEPIPLPAAVHIIAEAAHALAYAHDRQDPSTGHSLGIVHRDVKPDNILLSWAGEVKIIDFGCAKATIQQELTRPGVRKGTLDYMSPEQCLGRAVDLRSDIFSLGIVLYELITFARLYGDSSDARVMERIAHEVTRPPSWVNSEINASLDLIGLRALEKAPDDRFESAGDVARALEWWLQRYVETDPREQLERWLEEHYRPYVTASERFRRSHGSASHAAVALRESAPAADRAEPTSRRHGSVSAVSAVRRARSVTSYGGQAEITRRRSSDTRGDASEPGRAPVVSEERFRALQSIIARRSNLPPESESMVGRGAELSAIRRSFDGGMQLISVHGPPGIGKSKLARAHCRERLATDRPGGGVWWCDCSRDESGIDLSASIGGVLGLPGVAGSAAVRKLSDALAARGPMLLVLDGLDHTRSSVERLFEGWIRAAPELELIVTSRRALSSMRAASVALPPLSLPRSARVALESEAVRLLEQRIRETRPGFTIDAANSQAVAEMARALGGNPQAIEIAAARIARDSLEQELVRVRTMASDRPASGALGRETLASAVRWSWEQLHDDERTAFAVASVFHGGFGGEAAAAVIGGMTGRDGEGAQRLLESLQQRSLVQVFEPGDNPGTRRYRTVRIARGFARDRLIESGVAAEAMRRHADWHLAFAARTAEACFRAGGIEALRALRLEAPNITAIQHRALRVQPPTPKSATRALHAALAMEPVAILRSRYEEHGRLLDRAIAAAERLEVEPQLLASALVARLRASLELGGTRDDDRMLEAARLLAEADAGVGLLGRVEHIAGALALRRGETLAARDHFRRAAHLLEGTGCPADLARAYTGLAASARRQARLETAQSCLVSAQRLLREARLQHNEAIVTAELGRVRTVLDQPAKAGDDLRWARQVFRSFNDKYREAGTLLLLGGLERAVGEFDRAGRDFSAAVELARSVASDQLETVARRALESVRS